MIAKIKPSIFIALSASLAVSSLVRADDDCSAETLRGLYVFSASGFNIVSGAAQPKAITEYIKFNGDGTLTVPAATANQNGVVFRPQGGVGTYTVAPDCTGRLQFGPPGPAFDLFVTQDGSSIYMNQTGGAVPGVLQGQAKHLSN